jgi:hypothetical protein
MPVVSKCLILAAAVAPAAATQLHAAPTKPLEKWTGCGRVPGARKISAIQKKETNPGAGMDLEGFTPFDESFMDGFSATSCILDSLLASGDKFGDGKFSYKYGETHGVSIVNYVDHVAREDRESMTHSVCFSFCRTVPDMNFFGLTNGRDCYCAPFFKASAGDSSECDAPCDGDTSTMCGGKSKSTLFEMHQCGTADKDLLKARDGLKEEVLDHVALTADIKKAGEDMQAAAQSAQDAFGKVGDSTASSLAQSAKGFAGKLEHAAEDGEKLEEEAGELEGTADPEKVQEKEALTAKLVKHFASVEAMQKEDKALYKTAVTPTEDGSEKLFYPVMYFVDKEFREVPSTCGGTPVGEPLVGDFAGCAAACETHVGTGEAAGCVGFQHMPTEDAGLCFLFSDFKSATYYTGCKAAAFLQKSSLAGAMADTKCMAKVSEFEGTTLKPDPSGKCKQCLKEATKADRCFE